MTKQELIDRITLKLGRLPRHTVDVSVSAIINKMTETLVNDGRIEIRGFGSFHNVHLVARMGRNPKSGETVQIKAKVRPHFKPGKEMKERVNGGLYVKGKY